MNDKTHKPKQLTGFDVSNNLDDPKGPEEIAKLFAKYWNARDAKKLANLFADDADFVNVVGLWWHNKTDIQKAHHYGLTTFFKQSTIKIGRVKVRYLTNAIATVHVRWTLEGQLDKDGQTLEPRRTVMMFVVQNISQDIWQVVAAQNTDIIPGMETFVATKSDDSKSALKATDYRDNAS